MEINIPLKRQCKSVDQYLFCEMYLDKYTRLEICKLRHSKHSPIFYLPFKNLPVESQEKISNLLKTQKALNESKQIKTSLSDFQIRESHEVDEQTDAQVKVIFQRLNSMRCNESIASDKPLKIIGCFGSETLTYSVLFECKQRKRKFCMVSHDDLIKSYPELLINFLRSAKLKFQ